MAAQPLPPLPTPQQAELIGSTWAVVKESVGLQAAGEAFFKTLFAAHPEALGLFTKFKDDDPWQQSASFKAHALTVMTTIDTAFGMLGDLDTLMPVLRKLGARHVGYGAQPEHYDWVGSALVSTLQGALGASVMTGAATEAYVTVYTVVKAVMLQPADEQQPQPQRTVATKDIPAPPEVLTAAGPPVHKQMMKRSTSFKDGVVAPSPAVQPTSAPFSLVKQRRASMVKAGLIPTKRGSPMVWVGNIPPMADDEAVKGTLCAALSKFGEVRRVYPRRKATANGTWSFVLFRSTTMADKAVAAEVCIADEAGKDVQLRVERPRVNQELFKSQPGILIDVVQHVLQDKHTVKPAAQPLPPLPTPQQAELIGSTWAVVKESVGLQAAGEAFFKTLFAAHPEALGLFTKFKDDDPWQQSASFKAHALTVMTTIDTAFGMLGDLDTLMPVLRKLGARHVGYGAQPEHYDWVGSALVSTLQGALGASVMTGAATEAYVTVYTVVKAVMLQPGGMSPAPSKSDSTSVIDGSLEKHQALRAKYVKAKSMSDLLELEDTDALSPEQRSGRELWARVKASDDPDRGLSEGIPPQSVAVVAPDSQSSAAVAALAQNDEQNQLAAKSAIASKLDEVRAEERKITPILKALVSLYEGELAGLEHRFKSETSLFRKVMARLDKGIEAAAQELGVAAPKADEILESILDVLRFCAIFPTKTYTMSVKAVMAALKERGLTELRCKNYWGPGDGYQGINSVFISNSVAFELQFHTPESFAVKEEECHPSYEHFRTTNDSRKAMQYWEEMVSLWDSVTTPPGVLDIPKVVQQKLEFDLSMLTQEEQDAVKNRKALERSCLYFVDQLHSRAVKAQNEIGALMQYLMCKHGDSSNGCLEQVESKRTVQPKLSLLRQLVYEILKRDLDCSTAASASEDEFEVDEEVEVGEEDDQQQQQQQQQQQHEDVDGGYSADATQIQSPRVGTKKADSGDAHHAAYLSGIDGSPQKNKAGLIGRSESYPASKSDNPKRRRRRSLTLMMGSEATYSKLKVGVNMKPRKKTLVKSSSVDLKDAESEATTGGGKVSGGEGGATTAAQDRQRRMSVESVTYKLPEESEICDVLRDLETESPPLKYKIVCSNDSLYSLVVMGFIRDIAADAEYEVYAVNNWWGDIEKFGAITACFISLRHGIRFELAIHTTASWAATITHAQYMRFMFDTVIKTDVLFTEDPHKIAAAKMEMRREDMFREQWVQITIPDRALVIGTKRFAHLPAPPQGQLEQEARRTVGLSRSSGLTKSMFQSGVTKLININRVSTLLGDRGTDIDGVEALAQQQASSDDPPLAMLQSTGTDSSHSYSPRTAPAVIANAWAEREMALVDAFLAEHPAIASQFEAYRQEVVAKRGSPHTWRSTANRMDESDARMKAMETALAKTMATLEGIMATRAGEQHA